MTTAQKNKLNVVLKGLGNIGYIALFFLTSFLLLKLLNEPAPYEYTDVKYQKVEICPGETFSYSANLHANKKPIRVSKASSFFSESTKPQNFYYATTKDIKFFLWDKDVPDVIAVKDTVTFPIYNNKNVKMGSGNYRYIVSLQSEGYRHTASLSIPVTIKANCPGIS